MRRVQHWLVLFSWILSLWLPWAPPAAALAPRELGAGSQQAQAEPLEPTPIPTPAPTPAVTPSPPPDLQAILAGMTVADKVGQLFMVAFQGNDVGPAFDIATLVRDYRVGAVVLLPGNDNYRNVPVTVELEAPTGIAQTVQRSTPAQIAELVTALQNLTRQPPQPIRPMFGLTETSGITLTQVLSVTSVISPALVTPLPPTPIPLPTVSTGANIPLLIALNWAGDDSSFFAGTGGFTPLPSAMALGATWSPGLAEQVGQIVGQELNAVGVNLLLGPPLDVLETPRPGSKGDLETRAFGGDPYWVAQIGQAFIRGVQVGGQGAVVTAAQHFPGQGGSDRRPEDEVPTVQKSLQQLRQIDLAPFAAVTAGRDLAAPGITSALLTSHIRYRGLQASIREVTPPISLAPQLQELMALREFADWRAAGGVLVSEALGVPALRLYYSPDLAKFPHRQVAQEALLAGNDLLYLGRFALTDNWADQVAAIKETIIFFQDRYGSDSAFRARVDASVERLIRLKLRLYGGNWQAGPASREPGTVDAAVGRGVAVTQAVARAGLTLIYPGRDEFADRVPSAPLANENILIFTDARAVQECPTCPPTPLIAADAIEDHILRLYGPEATGQIARERIRSLTFEDLQRFLEGQDDQGLAVQTAIANARWIVFAQLSYSPEDHPASAALRTLLARRADSVRDKRLVVLAFNAPYYLDTTEISKLTAYFGVYSRTQPFIEAAVRALFREFTPSGALPVSVSGVNYELIRQLEPAAGQIIALNAIGSSEAVTRSIQVGSQIELETGIILDRNGHPVPDGTPVEFYLRYPAESLALAPKVETTVRGRARTVVALDRPGELWITAQAGEARDSTRIELRVGGDAPGSIAIVEPTPTSPPTATPSPTPEPTHTPTALPEPSPTPDGGAQTPADHRVRVTLVSFLFGLLGTVSVGGLVFWIRRRNGWDGAPEVIRLNTLAAVLWAGVAAWSAYLLYAVGWLPGATALQVNGHAWAAGLITFIGGALSLLWTGRQQTR